ncbi:MAG: hypothetical protein OCD01_17505 [Fibrobacterales bacterium]
MKIITTILSAFIVINCSSITDHTSQKEQLDDPSITVLSNFEGSWDYFTSQKTKDSIPEMYFDHDDRYGKYEETRYIFSGNKIEIFKPRGDHIKEGKDYLDKPFLVYNWELEGNILTMEMDEDYEDVDHNYQFQSSYEYYVDFKYDALILTVTTPNTFDYTTPRWTHRYFKRVDYINPKTYVYPYSNEVECSENSDYTPTKNDAETFGIPFEEYIALVSFYNCTDGNKWMNKKYTNWLNPDSSKWDGVTITGGNVTHIAFNNKEMNGYIPNNIGNLRELRKLKLLYTQVKGEIPLGLTILPNIDTITLSQNKLTGGIPEALGNLSTLKYISLYENFNLGSSIPKSLEKLTNISHLGISYCGLTGEVPDIFHDMDDLSTLLFDGNNLTGELPESILKHKNASISMFNEGICKEKQSDEMIEFFEKHHDDEFYSCDLNE